MRIKFCFFLLFVFILQIFPQNISNISVEVKYDTVQIKYDILGTLNDDVCEINLAISNNGGNTFEIIPQKITGDIGVPVKPGQGRKINWLPLAENIELQGDAFQFKLTGKVLGISDTPEFVKLSGGTFNMGNWLNDGLSDENKVHPVRLSDFEISMYEITNNQFSKFLNEYGDSQIKSGVFKGKDMVYEHKNGVVNVKGMNVDYWKPSPGKDYYPVVNVTWYGAYEYCKFHGYRLPSEAEWEYAARELGDTVRFGNGEMIANTHDVNFNPALELYNNIDYTNPGTYRATTSRVCNFNPNKLVLFDLSGNVWEWCQDWYMSNYYFNSEEDNPSGPSFGFNKVIRGGSWYTSSYEIRTTVRFEILPEQAREDIGFRAVREPVPTIENDK